MQALMKHLETSRTAFLEALDGLDPPAWTAKPAPDRWSVLEVVEHIATVEIGVNELLARRLLVAPCAPEHHAQTIGKDDLIVAAMRDRMTRRKAPDLVQPAGRWPSPDQAVDAFRRARSATIELLAKETRNLRDYCAPHPSLKALDGHQWILFLATHTDRHTEQVRDLRAADA